MKRKNILVVEDERIVAEDIKARLQKLGYDVPGITNSGEDSIRKAEKLNPDIILMDIVLEGEMDGIDAASIIQSRLDIPVVFLTAYSDDKTLRRAKITEPYGYLVKPFDDKDLYTTIEIALYRHEVGKLLKESEERYKALFDRSLSCVYVHDFEGNFLDANTAALNLLMYKKKDIMSLNFTSLLEKDQVPIAYKTIEEIKKTGFQKKPSVYRLRRKDGSYAWVETEATLIFRRGEPYAIQGIARDITEQKLAEEALRVSEERFRTMVETAPGMLMITDPEGKNIYVSPTCEKLIGYRQDELKGKMVWWVHEHDTPKAKKIYKQAFQKRVGGKDFEYKALKKNGDVWYASSSWEPLRDLKGKFLGVVMQTIDITERKKIDEEFQKSREQLRNLAVHLQSVREEERMLVAREIHDELGQSLTALKMDLSWLGKRIPEDRSSLLKKIESMSELVDTTIQTVKRISSELRPGLLDDLGLFAAIDWLGQEFQNRTGVKCEISIDSEEILLSQDRSTAIFRILQETLTNVARHAKATWVQIRVKKKNNNLMLNVKDNGKGILEEQISDSKSYGLIGIKERVHSLGGTISIKGMPDKGTKVTVSIPFSREGAVS